MDLLKIFWKPILAVFFLIVICICFSVKSCKDQKTESKSEAAKYSVYKADFVDNFKTADFNKKIQELDSAKKVEEKKAVLLKKSAERYYSESVRLRGENRNLQYKLDSLENVKADCPQLLVACKLVNKGLYKELEQQDSLINGLGDEAESYSRQLNFSKIQLSFKDSIILSKIKRINVVENNINSLICYRDWGFKHPFWRWVFGFKCKN